MKIIVKTEIDFLSEMHCSDKCNHINVHSGYTTCSLVNSEILKRDIGVWCRTSTCKELERQKTELDRRMKTLMSYIDHSSNYLCESIKSLLPNIKECNILDISDCEVHIQYETKDNKKISEDVFNDWLWNNCPMGISYTFGHKIT